MTKIFELSKLNLKGYGQALKNLKQYSSKQQTEMNLYFSRISFAISKFKTTLANILPILDLNYKEIYSY